MQQNLNNASWNEEVKNRSESLEEKIEIKLLVENNNL
jgi:hypothetical protein